MGHLMAVKDRQSATDNMFEPLKETIELLQSYDHAMSDEVHQQLEVCHEKLATSPGPLSPSFYIIAHKKWILAC